MSVLQNYCEAVRESIEQVPSVQTRGIVPQFQWVPDIGERKDLKDFKIVVAHADRMVEIQARSCHLNTVKVYAGFVRPLKKETKNTTAEAEQTLIDEVIDTLLGNRLGVTVPFKPFCGKIEHETPLDGSFWLEKCGFCSLLTFTMEQ